MAKAKKQFAPVRLQVTLKDFRRRWSIDLDEEQRWKGFKQRVLNTFSATIGDSFLNHSSPDYEYVQIIGVHLERPESFDPLDGFDIEWDLGSSWAYKELLSADSVVQFLERVQSFFWMTELTISQKRKFSRRIKEDAAISCVPLEITGDGKATILYPAGAKELDSALVDEVLLWLDEIPAARERYATALSLYGKPGHVRDVADNLRRSLEETLRHVLGNSKSLENQQAELGSYLKLRGIAPEVAASYWKLIDLYSKFQNDRVKHGDKVLEQEIELVLYLTGTFIRFLLTLK
jgi:hypothetical protein